MDGEAQIRELIDNVARAVRERDLDKVMEAYAPDAIIYDASDTLKRDREGLRNAWIECFDNSRNFGYEIHELKITASEHMAFSHCLSHATGTSSRGEHIDVWMRATDCFIKSYDKWLVIHEHLSVPADFVTGTILHHLKP